MNPFSSISTAIVHSSCVWAIAVAVIVLVGSSLVGSGPHAQAQNSSNGNYNATIIGGRPASMGGAFTGLADDSSAIVHNPAGLAQLSTSGISLSVTAYGFERTSVDNAFLFSEIEDLGIPEASVTTTIDSLLLFPATLAWVYPLGQTEGGFQHTAAFSVYVPNFYTTEFVQNLPVPAQGFYNDVYFSRDVQEFRVGPSYALQQAGRLGTLSFGASVFVQYVAFSLRSQRSTTGLDFGDTSKGQEVTVGERLSSFEYTSGSTIGATGNVGLLYSPFEQLQIGAHVQLPSLRMTGTTETYLTTSRSRAAFTADGEFVEEYLDANDTPAGPLLYQDVYRDIEGDTRYETPWVISVGAAFISKAVTLTADIDLYLPIDSYPFVEGADEPVFTPLVSEFTNDDENLNVRTLDTSIDAYAQDQVINYAIGGDIRLSDSTSLLVGAFTDFSWVNDGDLDELSQIDLYGASLGLRRVSDDKVSTFGLVGRYGTGKALGRDYDPATTGSILEPVTTDANVTQWSLSLVIGGTTDFGFGDDDEGGEPKQETP